MVLDNWVKSAIVGIVDALDSAAKIGQRCEIPPEKGELR